MVGNDELLISYMRSSFEKEKGMMDIMEHMVKSFSTMETYLNLMDSNTSCTEYASSSTDSLFSS